MVRGFFIFISICVGLLLGTTAAIQVIQLRNDVNMLLTSERRLKKELKLVKQENLECVIRSLETLVETREFVNSVFEERTFIPVDKNVFIAIAPKENKGAKGMVVEIENEEIQ